MNWRKSSRSGGVASSGCVELASDLQSVRDSKNPTGPVLRGDARALVVWVRSRYRPVAGSQADGPLSN
jgi:hypothetical protein